MVFFDDLAVRRTYKCSSTITLKRTMSSDTMVFLGSIRQSLVPSLRALCTTCLMEGVIWLSLSRVYVKMLK